MLKKVAKKIVRELNVILDLDILIFFTILKKMSGAIFKISEI
jgi:hypothetical protein